MIDAVARERSRGFVPPRRNAHKRGRAGSASARGCAHPLHASQRHLSATRGEELLLCNTMEPTIDLNLHPAQSQAQTLLVCNQIITKTAEQLNAFAATCEEKLIAMHYKMQRLETGVRLLESKLGSLPGGGNTSNAEATNVPQTPHASSSSSNAAAVAAELAPPPIVGAPPPPPPPPPPPADGSTAVDGGGALASAPPAEQTGPPEAPVLPAAAAGPRMKDDPRFAKYYKMVNFGVPKPVVCMKFQQETGLDPVLLDTPDAPAPPGETEEGASQSDGSDED